ncbi:hypothetical protein [Streptomyces rhizosphaericus]|uniref:Uncharacterized protein n=1 Tax=Streptomyces rhizosphaericus TaxID=114699 RepID=A0A6G4ARP3_9ACTN|nr:hypothetical protein [Streptomyces rhizosphaericus]NEW75251.1 hypothetical protein [Streptomyces rhizosphaericus]
MEQSTGPIIPPMHTAGTDPGYVPGLTSPRPADVEEDAPDKAAAEQPPEEVTAEDEPELDERDELDEEEGVEEEGVEAGTESDGEAGASKDDDAEDEDEDGGVAFEVSDRRGAIRAGRRGVVFELDGEKAEFGWDEIGAVEVDTPRFGKRFGITVYTTNRRWYTADVEAPARKLLKAWTAELDAVLDAYFEDSKDAGAEAEAEAEGKAGEADDSKDTDAKDATS